MQHQDSDQHDSASGNPPGPGAQQAGTSSYGGPANPAQPEQDSNVDGPDD